MTSPKLFGPNGEPLQFTKKSPPKLGNAYAPWAGREALNLGIFELPGGSFLQFDLSRLKLADYRQMTTHYQINSSLNLLAFMQHQADWHVEHPDKKVRDLLTENIQQMWTPLCRSRAQANWAGYSPSSLEWDNYLYGERPSTRITKIKDLLPEECLVNWKEVKLYAPPGEIPEKDKIYDGINKYGSRHPIPVENSFWYPMLMENGNYYGRKILKSVYTSYFFSMLMHLYANRYYERFGEPTPVGRAPFDDTIEVNGQTVQGHELMMNTLQNLRSRGVVMLPSDRTQVGARDSQAAYEYDIEYMESQMRGADFERMLTRYDQEMALGTFTPLLLQQTADVGSYNLGGLHYQMYLKTQNAMNADFGMYVQKYLLDPLIRYNFSQSTEPARFVFDKQDNQKSELVMMIIQALISGGLAKVDVDEIGQAAGLTLKEIRQLKTPTGTNPAAPDSNSTAGGQGDNPSEAKPNGSSAVPAGQTGNQ